MNEQRKRYVTAGIIVGAITVRTGDSCTEDAA
jgi:hypothetical protein